MSEPPLTDDDLALAMDSALHWDGNEIYGVADLLLKEVLDLRRRMRAIESMTCGLCGMAVHPDFVKMHEGAHIAAWGKV